MGNLSHFDDGRTSFDSRSYIVEETNQKAGIRRVGAKMELRKWRSHEGDLMWTVNMDGTERVLDTNLDDILCSEDPLDFVLATTTSFRLPPGSTLVAPIDKQEIWASGVTYERSRDARMEESKQGGDFYDLVYDADRPELFFKASPWRATGHLGSIRVRQDSTWDVPEPELTLVANNSGHIIGATIGNDVSSRSIEGENPLYLPQAKSYNGSCALGPYIRLLDTNFNLPDLRAIEIQLQIQRNGQLAFDGKASTATMKRHVDDLVSWLFRELDFPYGAFLMSGTGIVPDLPYTMVSGDVVSISMSGLGTLTNTVR